MPCDTVIYLPWPPSVNRYWRKTGRRVYLSPQGRLYRHKVRAICLEKRIARFTSPVRVKILAYPPDNRRRDLDNLLKAVFDALQFARVLADDYLVADTRIKRVHVLTGGHLKVFIRPFDPDDDPIDDQIDPDERGAVPEKKSC